jgi:hypothetical protein
MKHRIISSGGFGRRGWPNSSSVPASFDKERIWVNANQFSAHNTYPANGPQTRQLPNTLNCRVYSFSSTEYDLAFAWVPLPTSFWSYKVTAPTSCTLRTHWYTEITSSGIVTWQAEIIYVRDNETLNFVMPAMSDMYEAAGTQYILHVQEYANFPIYNPSGSSSENEGAFYLKIGRRGDLSADTFDGEAYLIGASVEFPLEF